MNSQDILKYYGSVLDIRLDSSEYYDYELTKTEGDYDKDVLDLSTPIVHSSQIIDSNCLTGFTTPWDVPIGVDYTEDNCSFNVRSRTEQGWTLNFVVNRESEPWVSGRTLYYWGITNEQEADFYLDNNLSFCFTPDGRIQWKSVHYSGYCATNVGYTTTPYISSGQTPVLCDNGTLDDFNITITFKRNKTLTDCDLLNQGGLNDLITGWTVTNPLDVLSGATPNIEMSEILNKRWVLERNSRLGELKIYLNGRPIYKIKDFEEVIPSQRESLHTLNQIWGGGTLYSGGIHSGDTQFNIKRVQYFEKPLDYIHVRHHYLVSIRPFYNIIECNEDCKESFISLAYNTLITDDSEDIITDDSLQIAIH